MDTRLPLLIEAKPLVGLLSSKVFHEDGTYVLSGDNMDNYDIVVFTKDGSLPFSKETEIKNPKWIRVEIKHVNDFKLPITIYSNKTG
jgi:hypothetical protein